MLRLTRITVVVATTAATLASTTAAHATPGHTSCQQLGALNVSEAHARTLAAELRSLPPGAIADLIAVVQVGGDFNGQSVPAFCQPK